jgi:hypothetical protein
MSELHFKPDHALTPLLTARALVMPSGERIAMTDGCVWEPTAVTDLLFTTLRQLTDKLPDSDSDDHYGMVDGDMLAHIFLSLQFLAEFEAEDDDGRRTCTVAVALTPHIDLAVERLEEGELPETSWTSPLAEDE